MARTIYWLVCEKHLHDSSGKNSYICVFDQLVAKIAAMPGAPTPELPLAVPCSSLPFTLAMKLSLGEGEHEFRLEPKDISGEAIAPPFEMKTRTGKNGMSFVNINFGNGIPIRDSGMIVFHVSVDGEDLPAMEMPVSVTVQEASK